MNERTIQIDVIGKIEGTQFMKCKLYTNENIVIIMMNEFDYERLKEEGIFIRDGKSRDSAGVLNTTNTFIEKINTQTKRMIMDKKKRILPHTKNLQRCFGKWQTYTLNWVTNHC